MKNTMKQFENKHAASHRAVSLCLPKADLLSVLFLLLP